MHSVLNRPLYLVLRKHFGEVRIRNENVKRVEERMADGKTTVYERGENYAVCCPLCADDHFRFSASYQWLTKRPFTTQRITWLANCYNEDCAVREAEFFEPLLDDLEAAQMGVLDLADVPAASAAITRVRKPAALPQGLVPLASLPADHAAVQFIQRKYQLPIPYLSEVYGVQYARVFDKECPLAFERVIFPIYHDGKLYSWQGRAISTHSKPRWFLPPGFVKCFYNQDMVPPHGTPAVAEGIPASIACGPSGIGIFGKQLNSIRAKEFGDRWQSAIVATDPETFVPDNRQGGSGRVYAHELRDLLKQFVRDVRMIRYPDDVLALATRHNNEEDVSVPDPADLGLRFMKGLIDAAL